VIELEGENGKLLASDDALELELTAPAGGQPAGASRIGHAQLAHPARFDLGGEELYLQDAAFLDWARGGPAPPNRAELALSVARVTEALYASAREGGRSVPVSA
jgi:predicted dehydrogenase